MSAQVQTKTISLRANKTTNSSRSISQTTKNQQSLLSKELSPKKSSSNSNSTANNGDKLSKIATQTSNTTLKSFINGATPKEIQIKLISSPQSTTTKPNQQQVSKVITVQEDKKPNIRNALSPSLRTNTTSKNQYQTSSNNPFLREGHRFINSIKKIHPETENFDGTLPDEVTLTLNTARTDRPSTANRISLETKEKFRPSSPQHPVNLGKRHEAYLQKIAEKKRQFDQEAKAREDHSKKQMEIAKHARAMRDQQKAEGAKTRPKSVEFSKEMQDRMAVEVGKQNHMKKKMEELARIEGAMMERLRASQTLETQAKVTMTRLSTMRISTEDLKQGNHTALKDLKNLKNRIHQSSKDLTTARF